MKRILFIFFVLASFVGSAQRPPNYVPRNTNEAILRQWVDSTFTAPAGVNPSLRLGPGRAGPLFVDTVGGNKGFHYYRDGAFIRLVDTTMTTLFGSTITNIGNGFDLAVSGTNNIKRFRDSLYFKLDSSVSGTVRGYIDTLTLGPWVRGFSSNLIVEDLGATGFPVLSARSNKLFGRKISATAGVAVDTLSTGEIVLTADDSYFNQYFRLIGRAGGQVAAGGTGSGESLTLTSNFTTGKKYIFFRPDSLAGFDEDRNRFFVGDIIPQAPYSVRIESGSLFRTFYTRNISNSASAQNVFAFYNDNADTSTAKGFQLLLTSSTYESAGVPIKNTGGLFNRYNGHIIFGTNAVERMRIDSLGNVGIGTTFPNGSSILDLSSTTKGFLPPRMNTTQQNAISPVAGLIIFNTDSSKHRYGDGSAWNSFGSGGGSGDVVGPGSATNNAIAVFDGTTGKLLKNSTITVSTNDLLQAASAYHNFGVTAGTSGYGVRDNAGTMEFKNSGGSWSSIGSSSQTPWTSNINGDGFTLFGNDGSGENLTLSSTSHATKGKLLFGTSAYDEVNNRLGIGLTSPATTIDATSASTVFTLKSTGASSSTGGSVVQAGVSDGAAMASGDRLGTYSFTGERNSSLISTGIQINGYANGTWSGTSIASRLEFEIGNTGATTRTVRFRQLHTGATAIGSDFTPTAILHLTAGTTGASTAPLKFTSGSLLTTAEAGGVEFLTDKYYGTITTGAARKELTLNDAALTSGRVPYVTTNGRITDDADLLFDGTDLRLSGRITVNDISFVGLDVDNTIDTLIGTKDGVGVKYVMPEVSLVAQTDSLASGRYTPTLTGITNIASVTPVLLSYIKVGSEIVVTGVATCTVTTGSGTFSRLSISLPPSFTSNFTLVTDCSGHGVVRTSAANESAFIETNTSTDVAEVGFYSGSGSHDIHFSFTYKQK